MLAQRPYGVEGVTLLKKAILRSWKLADRRWKFRLDTSSPAAVERSWETLLDWLSSGD